MYFIVLLYYIVLYYWNVLRLFFPLLCFIIYCFVSLWASVCPFAADVIRPDLAGLLLLSFGSWTYLFHIIDKSRAVATKPRDAVYFSYVQW